MADSELVGEIVVLLVRTYPDSISTSQPLTPNTRIFALIVIVTPSATGTTNHDGCVLWAFYYQTQIVEKIGQNNCMVRRFIHKTDTGTSWRFFTVCNAGGRYGTATDAPNYRRVWGKFGANSDVLEYRLGLDWLGLSQGSKE